MSHIVRPFAVTSIATTNVLETPPAAYNAGTTYALGDQVSVFSGVSSTVATMYESLQAGNTGNTPASSPAWWQEIGTAYLAWNSGTTYAIDAIVSDTTGHRLYQSLQNSNTNHAVTDTAWWVDIGPTNRWAMFDQINSSQTSRPLEVSATINTTGRIDSVVFTNLAANALNVTVTDGVDEFYNEDISLVDNSFISDYYDYFFEEIVRFTDYEVTGLPNILNPVISFALTDSGTVAVGNVVPGFAFELGDTQYGAKLGNTDYSRITTDDFGNTSITVRDSAKRGDFTIWMPAYRTDRAFAILDSFRGTALAFVGANEFTSTIQFGLLRDWNLEIAYPSHSVLSLQMQALT